MFKSLILLVFLISTLYGSKDLEMIQNMAIFKNAGIKVLKVVDKDSLYIVDLTVPSGQRDTIFLTKDKQYLISGKVIDTTNGAPLEMPVDISILKEKEAFSYGEGKEEFYLFTDTECPYCKKFESYFPLIKDKVKINIFFYPLSHHENAYDLSLFIMSQKTLQKKQDVFLNAKANNNWSLKLDEKTKKELSQKLNEQIKIANVLGVQGTPTLLDTDGKKVNWVQLLQKYGIQVR